jgi:hypothetical protein
MKACNIALRTAARATLVALACVALMGFGGDRNDRDDGGGHNQPIPVTVPKATCGPHDNPETGLQGQVPAALRATGFKGFNCNLERASQSRGDGAGWQSAEFRDADWVKHRTRWGKHWHKREMVCGYHGTASASVSLPGRSHVGVRVLDLSDTRRVDHTASLTTTSMLDPWESLKVNERRQLLAGNNGQNGGFAVGHGGPEVDIYDLSDDCRYPQLLATVPVGTGADGGIVAPVVGHEGAFAPDGLTYYGGDLRSRQYYAVDTTNPREPKLLATWTPGISSVHGFSISDDGRRGYFVSLGFNTPADLANPDSPPINGLLIYDLTEIQKRKPNPQAKLISKLLWKDGSVAQHTINVKIRGKPYIIFVDEGGSGGFQSQAQREAACAAGLPPYPMARIIDIKDEKNPRVVSKLMHEVHLASNCDKTLPDLVGLSSFTYGTHYCSVDNRQNATTLACGQFNSGIRVYDIRDPLRPKEIAYYNPAGTTTPVPGSNHNRAGGWVAGGPDWCSAQVHLDAKDGTLWTTCQDNGVLMLKFRKGVWPFPQSSTPDGQEN